MLCCGFGPVLAVCRRRCGPAATEDGRLLSAAAWAAFPACDRFDSDARRRTRVFFRAAEEWRDRHNQWRRRLLHGRRPLRPYRRSCRHPARGAAADSAYPKGIGQGGAALVAGADEAGAARATAGRLSGRTTPRAHDAGPGPATASGGRVKRLRRVALRPGGQTDGRGDQLLARRSSAWLDITGAGGARRHVAIDLCPEIQGDGRGVTDGISDALAHAAGWGQAREY